MNTILDNLISDLDALSKKIQKGKSGVDFLIEGESKDWGVPCYISTEIEKEYEKICKKLVEFVEQNPEPVTVKKFDKLKKVFSNSYGAVDSFRGRTPAGGGDWTDIESLVSRQISWTKFVFQRIIDKKSYE